MAESPPLEGPSQRQLTISVLIIEGDAFRQQYLQALLKRADPQMRNTAMAYHVTAAPTLEEATEILRGDCFDLVIVGLIAGAGNGTLLRVIRTSVGIATAVVAVGTDSNRGLVECCVRNQIDAYLPSPLSLATVSSLWQFCARRNPQLLPSRNRSLPASPLSPVALGTRKGDGVAAIQLLEGSLLEGSFKTLAPAPHVNMPPSASVSPRTNASVADRSGSVLVRADGDAVLAIEQLSLPARVLKEQARGHADSSCASIASHSSPISSPPSPPLVDTLTLSEEKEQEDVEEVRDDVSCRTQ